MRFRSTLALASMAFLLTGAQAQTAPTSGPGATLASKISITQKLDSQIPLELTFRDEAGKTVTLGSLYRGKPVILALVYYKCPVLCNQMMNGLLAAMKIMKFSAGDEYDIVFVGIDPRETSEIASKKKRSYIESYDREGAVEGWHFLTGDDENLHLLADSVGFAYAYDESTDQYAHPAVIMVSTPRGRLSKYFYGIEYSSRDLRLALVEASENKIGTFVDAATLYCFIYNPATGTYGFAVLRILQAAGILTLLVLGISICWMVRREKRRKPTLLEGGNS